MKIQSDSLNIEVVDTVWYHILDAVVVGACITEAIVLGSSMLIDIYACTVFVDAVVTDHGILLIL